MPERQEYLRICHVPLRQLTTTACKTVLLSSSAPGHEKSTPSSLSAEPKPCRALSPIIQLNNRVLITVQRPRRLEDRAERRRVLFP